MIDLIKKRRGRRTNRAIGSGVFLLAEIDRGQSGKVEGSGHCD